jgi:hypothetical protein
MCRQRCSDPVCVCVCVCVCEERCVLCDCVVCMCVCCLCVGACMPPLKMYDAHTPSPLACCLCHTAYCCVRVSTRMCVRAHVRVCHP